MNAYRPPNTSKQDNSQRSATVTQAFPDLSPRFQNKTDTQNRLDNTQHSITDTNTTSSLMTKSLATQQQFQDLENAIRQQNIDTRLHQAEFLRMNTRFDELEGRVLTTMAFCKDTSQNVLELRRETNDNLLSMRQEAATQAAEFRDAFANMTQIIHSMAINTNTDLAAHDSDSSTLPIGHHDVGSITQHSKTWNISAEEERQKEAQPEPLEFYHQRPHPQTRSGSKCPIQNRLHT
ncbi:hypothetical protein MHU86_9347 [Fragilaria crotonensis]|nr:hypothetical protein MHU86_9347 [Fragilaria crotonensis]